MAKLIHNLTNSPNLVERIKGIDRNIDTLNTKVGSIPEGMDVGQSIIDLQDNKQDKLTAGEGISIENNVISNTQRSAEWGNITGDIANQADLQNELSSISEDIPTKISDLINDSGFITNSVNDLVNYYLKSETYTQAEVNNLIGSIQSFHYEIYPTIGSITTPLSNVLYLIGPAGTGSDKYEEYVYSNNNFVKIGETSIDLSGYATIDNLNTALSNYTTTEALTILLAQKQNVLTAGSGININSNNEISADTSVLATKTDLNNKQDTLTAGSGINIDSNNEISADTSVLATKTDLNNKQDTLIAGNNIQIAADGKTISATDTKYTAGKGINIDANNEISNTLPGAIVSATAPSNPTEGMVWYDTTENSLKAYNGTSWETEGTKMVVMSYGNSTWQDFINAYNENAVVYCRASSNSNPATGAQNRLAFMAYVNNASSPTEVEFQYYRSRSSHGSDANQQDEVYIYKLTNASGGTWTVEIRDTAAKIATGTGLTKAYTTSGSKSTLTIANDGVLTVNGANGTVIVNDIKQSATAPDNPTAGTAWYDTTNGVLKVYNGTTWDTIATAGAVSDTAYGPGWNGQTTTAPSQNAVYDKISSIDALIPSEATSSNKLADKAFVGDSINSVTAYYITKNANGDQFATYAELAAATTFYSGGVVRVPTMNDYTIVLDDETHDHATTRYIYNNGWEYQYTVNETALTQAQLNALNSGITAAKVSTYDGYATGKQDTLVSGTNIKTINNETILGSGDISINGILSGPFIPAASATYAGRIRFDTMNNKFWKCDGTVWTEVTPVLSVNGGTGAITVNEVKVSSTAPSSPTEGMVWYDTTNDVLKVYDGTQWNTIDTNTTYTAGDNIQISSSNVISATDTTYTAGEGIEIKNGPDYSAMQGPAPEGFHIPSESEWGDIKNIWTTLGGGSYDGINFSIALKLPLNGRRKYDTANVEELGSQGNYWSYTPNGTNSAYFIYFNSSVINYRTYSVRSNGFAIRCFKDSPVMPTSSWTKLYGTSIETGGIFWNSTDGLISLSSNGQTWKTIADKNLGATSVWNSGDTETDANCGYFYQWGNNYGFSHSGTITTSSTQVDASNYGPGNYYNNGTFIIRTANQGDWSSVSNDNLWGATIGVITTNNIITNTGVLSVNGQTGNVTVDEGDSKVFTISNLTSAESLATATEAYTYACTTGKNAIIRYSGGNYVYAWGSTNQAWFSRGYNYGALSSGTRAYWRTLKLTVGSGSVTAITDNTNQINISSTAPTSGSNNTITLVI